MDLNILTSSKKFAVVGASADVHKVGHQILRNLHSNLELTVYPINLKGGTILDLPVYTHLWDTPEPAEIVVISVPVLLVESVIDDCIRIQAKAVILIASGFAETGESGRNLQDRIVNKLLGAGIALLGPNTMGYIAPKKQIYASFGPKDVSPGPIALISQSGAMLSALFQEYSSAGTGVSFALSLGNRSGINENDALAYAINDQETKLVVLYLESLADPKSLLTIAKQLSTTKPIFILKGGVTEEGRTAAVSHTASLATSEILLNDLCLQAGITQVDNFEQLVRASIACAKTSYLPDNLMVITNAGGPAVVLTDEVTELNIPMLSTPLDLLGDATGEDYNAALSKYANDLSVDAIVVIVTEQAVTDLEAITKVLQKPWGKHLLFVCLAGGDELEIYRKQLKESGVIVTRYPNEIADTLGSLTRAKKQLGKRVDIEVSISGTTNLYPDKYVDLVKLLAKYNIQVPRSNLVSKEADLTNLDNITYPTIAKTTNLQLLHKAKIGAVIQDIVNLEQAKVALNKLKEWGEQVVFQEKIHSGIEVLLGAHNDPIWGWYMAIGMGGSLSDTYDDRAYIFLPAPSQELSSALSRTKLTNLLSSSARQQLEIVMSNFEECVLSTENLKEIEINPLFVSEQGVIAADLKRS